MNVLCREYFFVGLQRARFDKTDEFNLSWKLDMDHITLRYSKPKLHSTDTFKQRAW
jgi:hypothetical protein